jgi:hypothetical protein
MQRRDFLGATCLAGAAAIGAAVGTAALAAAASDGSAAAAPAGSAAPAESASPQAAPGGLPPGSPLRVKPVLAFALGQRRAQTSWRSYGGLQSRQDVDQEVRRIGRELKDLAGKAEFPIEVQPVAATGSDAEIAAARAADADALIVYASGGPQHWLEQLAACGKPNLMFVRHRSGPVYLWYEIAHFRFIRKSEDAAAEPNMDYDDIVVDDYDDVLWRLRALYGQKNATGTKVLAVGGLQAYSRPGQELGPAHARNVWKFDVKTATHEELTQRLEKARADPQAVKDARRRTEELIAQPNVALKTDKQFVVNSFLALSVLRRMMDDCGATNLGVAQCMGGLIPILQTPPCLVLAMLNDDGYTAFCHSDFTHTPAGVLLRHISGKPSFVSNSHFPHHGMLTLAHCAAPRRMNGRDYEPTTIMTHFESDYGAATKVTYANGQVITNLVPNLHCTKWVGFRGRILDSPSYDMCRSQIDLAIDGDWRRLIRDLQGFHTITCYGDYLREVGYALKKVRIEWENVSDSA